MDKELTFTILCPDGNAIGLKNTVSYVQMGFPESKCHGVVGDNIVDKVFQDLSRHCQIYKGGKTITSLIDKGVDKSQTQWNFIVMAGCRVKKTVLRRYEYFLKSTKDILFPVIHRKLWFDEGSINGIYVHSDAFKEAGEIGDGEADIQVAKLVWASKAIEKGYCFKSLVGIRLF